MKHVKKIKENSQKDSQQLGINLSTKMKDLYNKNCKTFWKEIKEDTNKLKEDILCSLLEELILLNVR